MKTIKKKYIVDEQQRKVAVQIDIDVFNKIERILEDYALGQLMKENIPSNALDLTEAKKVYAKMKKAWKREDQDSKESSSRNWLKFPKKRTVCFWRK